MRRQLITLSLNGVHESMWDYWLTFLKKNNCQLKKDCGRNNDVRKYPRGTDHEDRELSI